MRPPCIQTIKVSMPFELRRKGGTGFGLLKGEREFSGRWKEQMFAKEMFFMLCRDNGTQRAI